MASARRADSKVVKKGYLQLENVMITLYHQKTDLDKLVSESTKKMNVK